jgi:hypothetical protein
MEGCNVRGEVVAVLEVEFLLATFFGGASGVVTARRGIVQDGCSKLLVDQKAGIIRGHTGSDGGPESVIDDLLGGGNLCCLFLSQIAMPAEHSGFKRAAMIEGQDV